MSPEFYAIDLPALLAGTLAAVVCGLVGNFLVLRRQALMGDAISHVVLPGIVLGFLVTGAVTTWPVLLGALGAALVAVLLIEGVRRLGRLEPGAAMGVVFTVMFAAGVVLLQQTAGNVHLDAHHALYGNLEATLWIGPERAADLLLWESWTEAPESVIRLAVVTASIAVLVAAFFKELRIVCFDPALATALGLSARWVSIGLMTATAVAAVAAFEAVGSILVIAMFICPAATARMLTDRLATQVRLSVVVAVLSGVLGYLAAAFGPALLWGGAGVNAAGMIAVTAGLFQTAAMLFAPRHGAVGRVLVRRAESRKTAAGTG